MQFAQGLMACVVIGAFILIVYTVVYLRYTPRSVKSPEYLREAPADLPPAVVDALFTSAPTPAKMVATLLDLVRRDVVVMNKVHANQADGNEWASQGDRALHLRRDRLSALSPAERDFVYELFDHIAGGADDVLLSALRQWWEHQYDPTLPTAHVERGNCDSVVFRPSLDLAERSPFARHGITD